MESQISYQRLIELNLIIEGCLRTLAVRESPDTQLMLTDCLAEFNELVSPLVDQSYISNQVSTSLEILEETEKVTQTDTEDKSLEEDKSKEYDEGLDAKSENTVNTPCYEMSHDGEHRDEELKEDEHRDQELKDEECQPSCDPNELDEIEKTVDEVESSTEVFEEEYIESPSNEIAEVADDIDIEESEDSTHLSHVETAKENDLRLDELLSRREARQLRKAFTLNDKFRFRRELFKGDDVMFARTLDMIQAMSSMEEATRYLCDDLGWDSENEHVADFMAIVANHFAEV